MGEAVALDEAVLGTFAAVPLLLPREVAPAAVHIRHFHHHGIGGRG
jgi:hypothetical protein